MIPLRDPGTEHEGARGPAYSPSAAGAPGLHASPSIADRAPPDAARRSAAARLALVTEVGRLLARAEDAEQAIRTVAARLVARLGGWCTVDLLGPDGQVHRAIAVHADPARAPLAHQLHRAWLPTAAELLDAFPAVPPDAELVADVSDALLRGVARDAEHLRVLQALGTRSLIRTPLWSGGAMLGVLTFATGEAGALGDGERALLEDVAARCAATLESARLRAELAEQRLRHTEAHERALGEVEAAYAYLQRVLMQAPAAVGVTTGPEHRIRSVNRQFEQFFGPGDYVGRPAREALPELARQRLVAVMDRVFRTGVPYTGTEIPVRWGPLAGPAAPEAYYNLICHPLTDSGGRVNGLLVFAADVTATVVARGEADRARREAESASRAKSEFLAVMSHELRTPLTAIIGYEELLADGITGPVTEEQRQQLGRIKLSAHQLLLLIEEILTFSSVEAGRERVVAGAVPVDSLLDDVLTLVRPLAEQRGLALHAPSPTAVTMQTDGTKLRQLLLNLLTNAIKFTSEGAVTLEARREGGEMVFVVRDTGIGIPPQHLEDIFEPFWQVEQRATRTVGGTGLGLSVARRFSTLLGGSIAVRSEPGRGSEFTVRIPVEAPIFPADPV